MSSIRRSYGAALRVTLRNTAAAYGYTLTTAATLSLLMQMSGKPDVGKLFLFALGGILAFALLEALLPALGPAATESPEHAFPYAGALNAASVAAALAVAYLVAHFVRPPLAWFLAPLGTTAIYMVLVAVQVSAISAGQRRRSASRRR
jgi:hypothetical protein